MAFNRDGSSLRTAWREHWDTFSEVKFYVGLSPELKKLYRQALKNRVAWGEIDEGVIKAVVGWQ